MNQGEELDEYAKWLPVLGTPEIEAAHLPEQFIRRLERIKGVYDYWLKFPNYKMAEIVDFEKQMFGIRQTQAYQDIRLVKMLLGNIESSTRAFWRWRINAMLIASINKAERAKDYRSVASMYKNLILNNKTDKEDPIELGFGEIVPQEFSMSDQISIMLPGQNNIPLQKKKDLINFFSKKSGVKLDDADFEEIIEFDESKPKQDE